MPLFFLLPLALQYGALLAAIAFALLLWRRTGILGFGGLAVIMLAGQIYSFALRFVLA